MTTFILCIGAFILGAWCEHDLDLSGQIAHQYRKWQARRRKP